MSIAHYIDHTVLKPTTGTDDILQLTREAIEYSFAAVCVPPYFVSRAKEELSATTIKVATVIGFPFGYSHYNAKRSEIKQAVAEGAEEVDMVINLAALRNGDTDYLQKEIAAISRIIRENDVSLKVIIESGILSDEEMVRCCQLYQNYDVSFLKTSTGYAEKGASVKAVQLMRKNLPQHIQIKASGGIKTYDFAKSLIEAGATRLGCSASVAIVQGEEGNGAGY